MEEILIGIPWYNGILVIYLGNTPSVSFLMITLYDLLQCKEVRGILVFIDGA